MYFTTGKRMSDMHTVLWRGFDFQCPLPALVTLHMKKYFGSNVKDYIQSIDQEWDFQLPCILLPVIESWFRVTYSENNNVN